MDFKTKTELYKENDVYLVGKAHNEGIDTAFESFKERVDIYKKFRGAPEYYHFKFPNNDWWKEHEKKYRKINNTDCSSADLYKIHLELDLLINHFNVWLFNQCFGDIE